MSYGTRLGLPLSHPRLVPSVLSHPDYASWGYVWGQSGSVHYCFMDPARVRFDIWQKEFQVTSAWPILLNLLALISAWWFPGMAWLAAALPTLPFALLDHYAASAKDQNAAVVTNGPQMRYPFGVSTAVMFGAGVTLVGVGSVLSGILAANAEVIAAEGLTVAGRTLASAGFLHALIGIGIGVNLGALALFLFGKLATPFGWVISPSINVRDLAFANWYHLGRNSTPLDTYRIAREQPVGLRWGCGGLIPIIHNKAVTSFAVSLENAPTNPILRRFQPTEVVLWGLLPLSDDPASIPRDWGSTVSSVDSDWNRRTWDELTGEQQALWRRLGWDRELWDGDGSPASEDQAWDQLSDDQRAAAEGLGYTPATWNGDPLDGLLVVAGSPDYNVSIATDLIRQGVTQAVATDGHLSPLLGTHGDLLMETSPFLDPIQKYGFMGIPE